MPFGKCRLCGRHIINPLLDTFLPHQNKIKCPSRLDEGFHHDGFRPPDWRKVSITMVFVLQIGGRFPSRWFSPSRLEEQLYSFNMAKVTAERVGHVSEAQAIICRKALKQEKIVKMKG